MRPNEIIAGVLLATTNIDDSRSRPNPPAIEKAIGYYGAHYDSFIDPKVGLEKCDVDLQNYPEVKFTWKKDGPDVVLDEETLLVTQNVRYDVEKILVKQQEWTKNKWIQDVASKPELGDLRRYAKLNWPDSINNDSYVVFINVDANLIKDLKKKYPKLAFDRTVGHGYVSDLGTSERAKPIDHIEAYLEKILHAMEILDNKAGKRNKQIVVSTSGVIDENDFENDYYSEVIAKAKRKGIKIHILKEPQRREMSSNDLAHIAGATSGTVRNVSRWSKRGPGDFFSITVLDAKPYNPGTRHWHIANGEGAHCEMEVTEEDIAEAIAMGRLRDYELDGYEAEKAKTQNPAVQSQ